MLRLMREHATSWVIKILLGTIVVVFIFWGVGSYNANQDTKAAIVNGEMITMNQYLTAYRRTVDYYREMYGKSFKEEMIEGLQLKDKALEDLIENALILQEARKQKFRVSDEELIKAIKSAPAFQENGKFDYEQYSLLLKHNGLSNEEFESTQRDNLMKNKFLDFIFLNVKVSDPEIREWLQWNKTTMKAEYVFFAPESYPDFTLTPEEISAYFEKNKESYKTDPERKVQYVRFDQETYKAGVQIPDDEIESYYGDNLKDFKQPKTVEASHILLKIEKDSPPEKVEELKKRSMEFYERAKAGENFAELAKANSDCPSKEKGGSLGAFKEGDMVKPFSDKAFSMKEGEIGEPILSDFGWHVIKVDKINEDKTTSLEEAKEGIRTKLIDLKAKNLASDAAYALYDNYYKGDNLATIAKSKGVEIKTTDFFTKKKGPGTLDQKIAHRFGIESYKIELSDISKVFGLHDGFYIIQVLEEKPAVVSELEAVKEKVSADLLKEKRDEKAKSDAEAFLAGVKDPKPEAREEMLKKFKVVFETTEPFERSGTIPNIGNEPDFAKTAFTLSETKKFPDQIVKGNKGYYVIGYLEKKSPDPEIFNKEKETTRKTLLDTKKNKFFTEWVEQLKKKSEIINIIKDKAV